MKIRIALFILCVSILSVLTGWTPVSAWGAKSKGVGMVPVAKSEAAEDLRGCVVGAGSSMAYPNTGPLAFSERESEDAKGELPMDRQGPGIAWVAVSSETDTPSTAVFLGEDGKPKYKVFVRAGETVSVEVREGAYDVMYDGGADWRGDVFGACSLKGKVKGIVVAVSGKATRISLYERDKFVLVNRLDPEAAKAVDVSDKKRRETHSADAERVARSRPAREGRPVAPQL